MALRPPTLEATQAETTAEMVVVATAGVAMAEIEEKGSPDKWGRRLFTTGAVVLLLLGFVHSLSLFGNPVPGNEIERQLFDLASNYKFNVMGSMRSLDNFLRGFSISFVLGVLCLGTLDLALSRERAALLKRGALINAAYLTAMMIVGLRYFFVFPDLFLAVALLIFALAWLKLSREAKS